MELRAEYDFYLFLSNLGFPPTSIIYGPAFQPASTRGKYLPDFALLDPKSNELMAVIEFKQRNDQATLSRAIQQVQNYVAALADKAVRGFVVTPAQTGEGFDFYIPGDDGLPKQVPSISFLKLESLSSARNAEKKELLAEVKKETTDEFLKVCVTAAAIAVAITVIDFICSFSGITLLTTERMALIGAAIALVIIPYVQKFKALGIEIERSATNQMANKSQERTE